MNTDGVIVPIVLVLFVVFFVVLVVSMVGSMLGFGGLVAAIVGRAVAQKARDDASPVEAAHVRVVGRRERASGGGDMMVSTSYYVTFEWDSGERREFAVVGSEYALIAEGDRGTLSWQGTRFRSFERDQFAQ